MEAEINAFTVYLKEYKRTSESTVESYRRDLMKVKNYLEGQGVFDVRRISSTHLNSYILYLEKIQFSPATISRNISTLKTFYHYLLREGIVRGDVTEMLRAPRVEKKPPEMLTPAEKQRLLAQTGGDRPKEIRDRAMLTLLCATGIRVTELLALKVQDVNWQMGYLVCRDESRERVVSFGDEAGEALHRYMEDARSALVKEGCEHLFVNSSGKPMSRQGFWKLLKAYADRAGIRADITPQALRNSGNG